MRLPVRTHLILCLLLDLAHFSHHFSRRFAEAGRAARLLGLKGTYQDALDMFQKAESLCPHACYDNQGGHYNRNWLMIVKAFKAVGKMDEAREWLKKLLEAEVHTPDDRTALAEAQTINI